MRTIFFDKIGSDLGPRRSISTDIISDTKTQIHNYDKIKIGKSFLIIRK